MRVLVIIAILFLLFSLHALATSSQPPSPANTTAPIKSTNVEKDHFFQLHQLRKQYALLSRQETVDTIQLSDIIDELQLCKPRLMEKHLGKDFDSIKMQGGDAIGEYIARIAATDPESNYIQEDVTAALIDEALLLDEHAQSLLETTWIELKWYDPRIYHYLLVTAKEGIERSQALLGWIHLLGVGVNRDEAKGLEWLKATNTGKADQLLEQYWKYRDEIIGN